jgi:hypothetical protein
MNTGIFRANEYRHIPCPRYCMPHTIVCCILWCSAYRSVLHTMVFCIRLCAAYYCMPHTIVFIRIPLCSAYHSVLHTGVCCIPECAAYRSVPHTIVFIRIPLCASHIQWRAPHIQWRAYVHTMAWVLRTIVFVEGIARAQCRSIDRKKIVFRFRNVVKR